MTAPVVVVNRSIVRVIILVLCILALIAIGIAILAGHGKHLDGLVGTGFIVTAVGFISALIQ
jgi:hypothetical protein